MTTDKKEKKAKKERIDLDGLKDLRKTKVAPEALKTLREEYTGKKLPSVMARSMADDMFRDINGGYSIDISSPQMKERKDVIKSSLVRDLMKVIKVQKKNYRVKTIEKKNEIIFFFEERPEKKKKDKTKTENNKE